MAQKDKKSVLAGSGRALTKFFNDTTVGKALRDAAFVCIGFCVKAYKSLAREGEKLVGEGGVKDTLREWRRAGEDKVMGDSMTRNAKRVVEDVSRNVTEGAKEVKKKVKEIKKEVEGWAQGAKHGVAKFLNKI
jgi:hypothetical protein